MIVNFQNNFGVSLGEKKINVKKKYEDEFSIKLYNKTINKTGPRNLFYAKDNTSSLDLAFSAYKNFLKKK